MASSPERLLASFIMDIIQKITNLATQLISEPEITLFVRLKYRDDTEEDNLVYMTPAKVAPFVTDLLERTDVKECWVFKQIHHHGKACTPRPKSSTETALVNAD